MKNYIKVVLARHKKAGTAAPPAPKSEEEINAIMDTLARHLMALEGAPTELLNKVKRDLDTCNINQQMHGCSGECDDCAV